MDRGRGNRERINERVCSASQAEIEVEEAAYIQLRSARQVHGMLAIVIGWLLHRRRATRTGARFRSRRGLRSLRRHAVGPASLRSLQFLYSRLQTAHLVHELLNCLPQ